MADAARLFFLGIPGKKIGTIDIDAFIQETHTATSTITRYPIESGSNVSDHIYNEPKELSINGYVGVAKLLNPDLSLDRALDAYNAITELMNKRELVTIVSGLRVYNNMHIEDFSVDRTKETGANLVFNMTCKEAQIVTSQTVTVPIPKIIKSQKKQAAPKVDMGFTTSGQNTPIVQLGQIDLLNMNTIRTNIPAVGRI